MSPGLIQGLQKGHTIVGDVQEQVATPTQPQGAKALRLADLKPKMRFEGTVKKIELFGAFVDIGAERNGLVHISQLRQGGHVNRVADVVKEGDRVTVWVKGVESQQNLINLTMIEPPPLDWGDLQRGTKVTGKVVRVEDFGAFVSFGAPKDGLIPTGQMVKGRRINKPSDVVAVGDEVTAWIISVDRKRERIGLSLIEPPAVSWAEVKKGHTYTGKVTRLERYGAFVDIGAERDGLVHISELAPGYVRDASEIVNVGDKVEVTVVDVDARKRQIQLSMKEANAVEDEPEAEPELTLMEQAFQQARATARPRRESVQNQLRGEKGRGRGEQDDIMRRTLAQRGPRD
jgi:small subunit ribosomal protein S1